MISIKEQLRKSLLEVCTPEDLREWFDPLELRYEPGRKPSSPEAENLPTDSSVGVEEQMEKEPGFLVVTLPHALFADWFDKKGRDLLESTVALFSARTAGENEEAASVSIRYEAPETFGTEPSRQAPWMRKKSGTVARYPVQDGGPREPGFEDFVTNAKHRNVLHVLRDLLPRNPRSVSPVVLYGPPGSGKTHLLAATTGRLQHMLGTAVLYSADAFDPDKPFAQNPEKGRAGTQNPPLADSGALLVDNMHRLPATEKAQSAFVRLLENRLAAGAPVVLAGTGRLSEWPLDETLRSRLHAGVLLALPEADLDMCLRYAQQRARTRNLRIDRDTLLDLARRFPDMRRLEGAMRRLEALSGLLPADRNLTPQEVEQLASHSEGPGMTAQAIMHLVGESFGIQPKDMQGGGRKSKVVLARQMGMYLCRELLGLSFPIIGQLFGGKDHSTAIHAVRKIKQLQANDSDTNILVTELTKRCRKLAE